MTFLDIIFILCRFTIIILGLFSIEKSDNICIIDNVTVKSMVLNRYIEKDYGGSQNDL